jgi:hypothetical protein
MQFIEECKHMVSAEEIKTYLLVTSHKLEEWIVSCCYHLQNHSTSYGYLGNDRLTMKEAKGAFFLGIQNEE